MPRYPLLPPPRREDTAAALADSNALTLAMDSYVGMPSILGMTGLGKLSMRASGVGTELMVGSFVIWYDVVIIVDDMSWPIGTCWRWRFAVCCLNLLRTRGRLGYV